MSSSGEAATPLVVTGLAKTYATDPPVHALRSVDLCVEGGERVAIIGRSGAGKSTLLNILGLLDEPSSGSYRLLGKETRNLTAAERDSWRAQHLGFIFQDYHILGHRTAYENVELKLAVAGVRRGHRQAMITEGLASVGLSDRMHALGRLLSGGEKQRLAIARAVVGKPTVVLADEPTGNLDAENADVVLGLFDEQSRLGVSVVIITHDLRIAAWADKTYTLRSGSLTAGAL